MNKGAKIYITILSIITVIAVLVGIYIHVFRGFSSGRTRTVEGKQSLEGRITDIEVENDAADITIDYGDELAVSYNLPEKEIPVISLKDGKLSIKNTKHKWYDSTALTLGNLNRYISITIPRNSEISKISAVADAGNINIYNITAKKLSVITDAGNISLKDTKLTDTKIEVDAGNVKMDDSETDTFKVDVDAGNITLNSVIIQDIDAELDAGNIKAKDSTIRKGRIETDFGNIVLNGDIGDVKTKTDAGNIEVNDSND